MRYLLLPVLVLSCCRTPTGSPLTWEEWSRALLDGSAPAVLTPIPASGWEHRGEHGWFRDSAQVADYNGDGAIDYIRIQDPPGSYNHRVWVDLDHDGFFDRYRGALDNVQPESGYRVPKFEPR